MDLLNLEHKLDTLKKEEKKFRNELKQRQREEKEKKMWKELMDEI